MANRLWKLVRLPYRALLKRTLKMTRRYTLGKRDRLSASAILRLGTNWVPAEDARARLQEREARMAADNRTDQRIRAHAAASPLGQFDRTSEMAAIDVGGRGHGGTLENKGS